MRRASAKIGLLDSRTTAASRPPVPEPAGLVLLGTGAVALLGYYGARRRARPRA